MAITVCRSFRSSTVFVVFLILAIQVGRAQQPPSRFGGTYSGLDARRQGLVDNWVARFVKTTGQRIEAAPFYDDELSLSTKATFEAVTHALMATALTDRSGASLGDALALVTQVEDARGDVAGAPSDHQFRLYVLLAADALDRLERSQQFQRGTDNTVYHMGYPTNYRSQGGPPSIQISIAFDKRHADIDVDYRDSSFPAGLFSGHLTAANSDVRAGNNVDLHNNRWTGFQNWWRSFLGVRQEGAPKTSPSSSPVALPTVPRAGKGNIEVLVNDFLAAWLVEGDLIASMGYVSDRAYACMARETDDPSTFDYGVAPFQLMINLKAAYDSLAPRASLDGLVAGTSLETPALRLVRQPHQTRFAVYSVPNDVATSFDCERQLARADPTRVTRLSGTYFLTTFHIDGRRDTPVAIRSGPARVRQWLRHERTFQDGHR